MGPRCYGCGVYLDGYNGSGLLCDDCRDKAQGSSHSADVGSAGGTESPQTEEDA